MTCQHSQNLQKILYFSK